MSVEFIPAAHVRELTQRIQTARERAAQRCGPAPREPSTRYWETLFETNAAEVLTEVVSVRLGDGYVVRYRYFGERGGDVLVRPFVARATTDVDPIRQLIDWHPAPDAMATIGTTATRDSDLLYRHFEFPRTAVVFFDYWLLMQELWASGQWVHSHVLASAAELSQLTARTGWEVVHPVQAYEPAVVVTTEGARLAVLIHTRLQRLAVHLQQIEIAADQSLRYGESVLVASGPRGYVL